MNAYVEIFLIFILPIVIWNYIAPKYRAWALLGMTALVVAVILLEGWTLQKLGIRIDNFAQAIVPSLVLTILAIGFLWVYAKVHERKFIPAWIHHHQTWFWVIFGSILQEFVYRGFLMPKLGELTTIAVIIILVNAVLFLLPHLVYPELKANLLLIFLGGIMFAGIYYFYPNLILVSATHMILNFIVASFGFITENPEVHENF